MTKEWCEQCKWFEEDSDWCNYGKHKVNPRTDSSEDYEGDCAYNK